MRSDDRRSDRLAVAAHNLGVDRAEVFPAVCRFQGLPEPDGLLATQLVERLAERLGVFGSQPLRTIDDLSGATLNLGSAVDRGGSSATASLEEILAFLDVATSRLTVGDLQVVSRGFGVTRGQVRCAVLAVPEEDLLTDGSESDPATSASDGFGDNLFGAAEQQADVVIKRLTTLPPERWDRRDQSTLRIAIRAHLAEIADVINLVVRRRRPRLSWSPGPDGAVVEFPVAGAPRPLEARITCNSGWGEPDRGGDAEPVLTGSAVTAGPVGFHWQVGWRAVGNAFGWVDGGDEPSLDAAMFAAELSIEDLAREAATLRQPFTHRLFVPRSPAITHPDLDVIDLMDLLTAANRLINSSGGEAVSWANWPHTLPGNRLNSMTAALFDDFGVACPGPGEPANERAVTHPEFAAFLDSHAFRLSPLAEIYLDGTTLSGSTAPGAFAGAAVRHAAGVRALLQVADELLVRELPLFPDEFGLAALSEPVALARYLARVRGMND